MDKSIRQLFFDKNSNIYVVDENNVLYLFDEGFFYPFMLILNDIKECFSIDELFFVYHSNTITMFDENLRKSDYSDELCFTNNINEVCYNPEYKIISTLEQNKIYCNYAISSTTFLDGIRQDQIILQNKYHSVKIINDMLLTLSNKTMDIFFMTNVDVIFIRSLQIEPTIFGILTSYSETYSSFSLTNGNIFLPTSSNSIRDSWNTMQTNQDNHNNHISDGVIKKFISNGKIANNEYFYEKDGYFAVCDQYLLCCYNKTSYSNIVSSLLSLIPSTRLDNVTQDDKEMILFSLKVGTNIIIKNNETSQIIFHDQKIYFINKNDILYETKLTNETICMEKLDNCLLERDYNTIFVDINPEKSIVEQLLNIVPSIYRLNNEPSYVFEHISYLDDIISYGEGTSRQTYSLLRKELDTFLENKFSDINIQTCYNLGKIFYFCIINSGEKFINIHPYFFYAISKETDYLILLNKFKADKFEMYKNQYIEYKTNPSILVNLDLGLETHNDYIKYIFTADLSEKMIESYDYFIKGFQFFATRNKYNQIIKNLPITYYIKNILAPAYFSIKIFFSTIDKFIATEQFAIFCETIKKKINELTDKEIVQLTQNITGCRYYNKSIEITYAPNVSNKNQSDSLAMPAKNIIYEISTCNAQLIIYTDIDKNIDTIITCLTIEDSNLKN